MTYVSLTVIHCAETALGSKSLQEEFSRLSADVMRLMQQDIGVLISAYEQLSEDDLFFTV